MVFDENDQSGEDGGQEILEAKCDNKSCGKEHWLPIFVAKDPIDVEIPEQFFIDRSK